MASESGWKKIAITGFIVRVAFILCLSIYQNIQKHELMATDIDYKVYSDAALYSSPYERHTYRYSPIISYMMVFNYSVHQSIGKIFFALWDVIAIGFLYSILSRHNNQIFQKTSIRNATLAVKAYAYNPLFIYLTVRGSCESITLALMYAFWYFMFGGQASGNQTPYQNRTNALLETQPIAWKKMFAYIIYGLWVHIRVYPIIFLPLIVMHEFHAIRGSSYKNIAIQVVNIGIVAGGIFIMLGSIFYLLYGYKFLQETYLYHLWRKDSRHSFSPFFYEIYLNHIADSSSTFARSLVRVIPTLYIILSLSFIYVKNYSPFYLHFLITFGFVTFNKVITLQYYMWVFGSILLVMPESLIFINQMYRKGWSLIVQYLFPIMIWIWLALRLEDMGQNNLHTMWIICIFTVFMHLWVLINFLQTIRPYNPIQEKRMRRQKAIKLLTGVKED